MKEKLTGNLCSKVPSQFFFHLFEHILVCLNFTLMKRPAKRFTVEHAKINAAQYVKAALERMQNHPIFTGTYLLAVLALTLVTSVLQVQDSSALTDFSVTLVTALWFIATAGDDKFLQPEAMDVVWKHFHKFKLSSIHEWKSFLESISICTDGNHVHLVIPTYVVICHYFADKRQTCR